MALQSVLRIAVMLAAEWLFVHFMHALQIQARGARLPRRRVAGAGFYTWRESPQAFCSARAFGWQPGARGGAF
jgi:hypothetical protein